MRIFYVSLSPETVHSRGHTSVFPGLVSMEIEAYDAVVKESKAQLKALCVARHPFIAEHFARFFTTLGIDTRAAVGLDGGTFESRNFEADIVICEYELLATLSLEAWENDDLLSTRPVIAVSLSRRPNEAHALAAGAVSGFLYLPLVDRDAAMRVISAAAASSRTKYVPAPATTSPLPSFS